MAFNDLKSKITELVKESTATEDTLLNLCTLLKSDVSYYDWVGFYFRNGDKKELKLGPYAGAPTDHTIIPFGKGICGQVALSHETFVSQDVTQEDNYISCSHYVQSEIVVPIMVGNDFVAQIDIDSNKKNAISEEKKELLEKICTLLSNEF